MFDLRTLLRLVVGALACLFLTAPAWAACGDGILEAGEECDDQNVANGDGCSSTCAEEAYYTCTDHYFTVTAYDGASHSARNASLASVHRRLMRLPVASRATSRECLSMTSSSRLTSAAATST